MLPGNPIDRIVSPMASAASRAQVAKQYGLDLPLDVQYVRYMGGLLHGDMGVSFSTGDPVAKDLESFFPATLELTTYAMIVALIAGLGLGLASAVRRNTWIDSLGRILSVSGIAIPVFWLAIVLVFLFAYRSHVMPAPIGRLDPHLNPPGTITGFYVIDSMLEGRWADLVNSVRFLILPVFCLAFGAMAPIARMGRSGMIEALRAPYLTAATALGLPPRSRVLRHALRNALLPVVTMVAVVYGFLLGGSVLVENIFAWPGLGRYAYNAISGNDYPAVEGFILYATTIYVLMFLIADVVYALLDPRIER